MVEDRLVSLIEINCPLCGSSEKNPVLQSKEGHFLSRCAQCEFQFYSPRPAPDRIEAYYHEEEFYEKVNITAVEIVMDILGHHQLSSGKLLDVGCGVGALVAVAGKKGWDAVGMDPSEKAKELSKKVLDIEIINSYLADSCFDPESFDVVILLAVLEHAFDPLSIMKQVAVLEHAFDPLSIMKQVGKILKPGGRVIFSTPNLDNLPYHLMGNKAEYSWFVKEHINHFTIKTHRTLLEKAGFQNPEFLMSGHFAIAENDQGRMLLPGQAFARAARNLLANSLEPSAQKMFGKPSTGLTDQEVLELIGKQAASWNLPPGEYTLSHAVYVSAQKANG
jgi:2-polyprenyl-3-methyl-5-hydroxy-6-metoxy-1,4-benzoquinol methylase